MDRRRFLFTSSAVTASVALALSQDRATADERHRAADFDPTEQGLRALQTQLSQGLTSTTLVLAYLERIRRLDQAGPTYRSVIAVNPQALDAARALDAERRSGKPRGPLHGIPVLIKDNIETLDPLPTTAGSLALAGAFHRGDAPLVARLRAAGAIVLGKTNLSEWANFRSTFSSSGWSAVGGQTGNAYDPARDPSGSSSGSATATALSFCAAAIGTETDGSILSPAAVNGLVGFKPTLGAVDGRGIVPLSPRQDVAGPMTRSVDDAAILMAILRTRPSTGAGTDVRPRVGFTPPAEGVRSEVAARYAEALAVWRRSGAELVEVTLPRTFREAGEHEFTALLYEFKASLDTYLAALAPGQAEARSLAALIEFNRRNADRELARFGQEIFEMAAAKGPLTDAPYLEAIGALRRLVETEGLVPLFRDRNLDVVVAPGAGPANLIDPLLGDRSGLGASIIGSAAAIAGYPSLTLPIGLAKGLPVGMTLVAPRDADDRLLQLAALFEREGRLRVPPKP
jgi:amidase